MSEDRLWGFLPFYASSLFFVPPLIAIINHLISGFLDGLTKAGHRSAKNDGDVLNAVLSGKSGWPEIRRLLNEFSRHPENRQIRSQVAGEMLTTSVIALLAGVVAIFLYITFRFEFSFAMGAIIALVHDLVIVIGITVLCGKELNLILVGAFLTIAGYSINDTIVVFDRIREGLKTQRGAQDAVMNNAINSTLTRTILTSVTTLLTVFALYLFGGPSLRDFSFAIIIGVLVGTYSSIFVASPVVAFWAKWRKINLRREILDAEQETVESAAATN